jgi:acetyl esterase/lipase
MPGSTPEAWGTFVQLAQRAGYASLVVDATPLDAAGGPVKSDVRHYTAEDWATIMEALGAAKAAVLEHGADPDNLFVGGAGVTANLALRYAHDDLDIHGTILLSPGLEYSGVAIESTMRDFGKRPVFIAVTEGDAYAHSSSLQLHTMARGFCELRVYDGAAHGTDMFGASESVADQLVLWLKSVRVSNSA